MKKTEPKIQKYCLAFINYRDKYISKQDVFSCVTVLDLLNCYDIVRSYIRKRDFGRRDAGKYVFHQPKTVLDKYFIFPGRIEFNHSTEGLGGVFVVILQQTDSARRHVLRKIQKEILDSNLAGLAVRE